MKKILLRNIDLIAVAASIIVPALAAADSLPPVATTTGITIFGANGVLCTVFNILFIVLIILVVIFILLAAFKYLTAAGDPEKVKAASHQLLYAVVALVVAFLAKVLPGIVGGLFGAQGVGNVFSC